MSCKKKCPVCGSRNTKKNGKRKKHQCYKCISCRTRWGGRNIPAVKWAEKAYRDYVFGRQTFAELQKSTGKNPRTLQRHFDILEPITGEIKIPSHPVSVILDATFFSRRDGVLVARAGGRNLIWKEVETERLNHYGEMLDTLSATGVQPAAFVIDGRRGVLQLILNKFSGVPVQLCQFHQLQTMTHYLSTHPKLQAGRELRGLALTLAKTSRQAFAMRLDEWHRKWQDFLQEKSWNPEAGRWHYTHRRIRSAYRSLHTNLYWLFTYHDFPERHIPNTTNSCDGSFAHWKNRIKIHRGLRKDRKQKMMHFLLENS